MHKTRKAHERQQVAKCLEVVQRTKVFVWMAWMMRLLRPWLRLVRWVGRGGVYMWREDGVGRVDSVWWVWMFVNLEVWDLIDLRCLPKGTWSNRWWRITFDGSGCPETDLSVSSRETSSLLSGVNYLLPGFLVSVAALCTKHPGRRRARSPPATSGPGYSSTGQGGWAAAAGPS